MRKAVLLVILLLACFGPTAKAASTPPLPILLTINISDPSHVIITATGLSANTNSNTINQYAGVDLLAFFSPQIGLEPPMFGNLTPSGDGTVAYDSWATDSYTGSSTDFNLYTDSESLTGPIQTFSTDTAAFTGFADLNLSDMIEFLPTGGSHGSIMVGYSANYPDEETPTIIGEWVVTAVPEPSSYGAMAFLGLAGLIGCRRFSSVRQA